MRKSRNPAMEHPRVIKTNAGADSSQSLSMTKGFFLPKHAGEGGSATDRMRESHQEFKFGVSYQNDYERVRRSMIEN